MSLVKAQVMYILRNKTCYVSSHGPPQSHINATGTENLFSSFSSRKSSTLTPEWSMSVLYSNLLPYGVGSPWKLYNKLIRYKSRIYSLQPNFKRIRATPLYLICFWISDTAQIDVDRPARSVSTSLSSSTTLVTSACAKSNGSLKNNKASMAVNSL